MPNSDFCQSLRRLTQENLLGPARAETTGGRISWKWYVDDDDDRFVRIIFDDVPNPPVVEVAYRDGLHPLENRRSHEYPHAADPTVSVDSVMNVVNEWLVKLGRCSLSPGSQQTAENMRRERGFSWRLPRV